MCGIVDNFIKIINNKNNKYFKLRIKFYITNLYYN